MFMKWFSFLPGLMCVSALSTSAQHIHQFRSGLIAPTGTRYGREAVFTDPLAYHLYNGSLKTPTAGAVFSTNEKGEKITWIKIEADSTNRLRTINTEQRNPGVPAGPGVNMQSQRGAIGRGGAYVYLTYTAPKAQTAVLNVKGNSAVYVNGAIHTGDVYNLGYMYIPVALKKGLNEFYVRGAFIEAALQLSPKALQLNTEDLTLPSIVIGKQEANAMAGLVVLNTTNAPMNGLQIRTRLDGKEKVTAIPAIPAMSSRKVAVGFDGTGVHEKGKFSCEAVLLKEGKVQDTKSFEVEAVLPTESYSNTFVSDMDGSLQYYSVTPRNGDKGNALFLSVHGAGVEALGQARAYRSKDWGTLVAATNRRPRGFNWEDWGRLDALEVLNIAKNKFNPDPQSIYLTGHSMGGHGTWFLGATYPDKWAAIAPCAGYPTMKGYGSADGLIPDSSADPLEQLLLRSSNQSDVPKLAFNYKPLGVYVFHGDADRTVPVTYARQMRQLLGTFHPDMSYYEYPGGSHWFGDHSVDWKPMFDFFQWHKRPIDSTVNTIDFSTASPGISAAYYWAGIYQQQHSLMYSRIQLNRDLNAGTISGTTQNVAMLAFALKDFMAGKELNITLDGKNTLKYVVKSTTDSVFLANKTGEWQLVSRPSATQKGPHRYGTLKDAFQHNMVFVYGTTGTKEENDWSYNKARYDAETWYYRGNGAVDIIPDKAYSIEKYRDRGVILVGNRSTNSAWDLLLKDCPIQVDRNKITNGNKTFTGDDLAAYLVWPLAHSNTASVAAITGTGLKGMKAADGNQYFAGASGFPDYMIFSLEMLKQGASAIKSAGFFSNEWKLSETDAVDRN